MFGGRLPVNRRARTRIGRTARGPGRATRSFFHPGNDWAGIRLAEPLREPSASHFGRFMREAK